MDSNEVENDKIAWDKTNAVLLRCDEVCRWGDKDNSDCDATLQD